MVVRFSLGGEQVNKSNKAMLMGIVVAVLVLVFVPSLYVTVSNKLGKAAELQKVGA